MIYESSSASEKSDFGAKIVSLEEPTKRRQELSLHVRYAALVSIILGYIFLQVRKVFFQHTFSIRLARKHAVATA
ncbi:hypothetical protein ACU4GI_25945 [Cupriavidus basilensis]